MFNSDTRGKMVVQYLPHQMHEIVIIITGM
jgi:hypothetical protein